MLNVGLIAASSAGGRGIVPVKPTATHTGTGQFTLGAEYSATNVYTLTASAGSATRNGAVVSLSNANSVGTITAKSPKGVTASTALTVERRAITYTTVVLDSFETFGGCPDGYNFSDFGAQGTFCILYGSNEDSPPAGFTKNHGEWAKIT